MKKLLLFLTLYVSSLQSVLACGFSPYGEDTRFMLFSPHYFQYENYASFHYNAFEFGFSTINTNQYDKNVYAWHEFTKKKVSLKAIDNFLYHEALTDLSTQSTNDFVKYLYENKLQNAIDYLLMAKKSEGFSMSDYDADPWERNREEIQLNRADFINQLIVKCKQEKDAQLKRRYAFLIVRLAYYADNKALIERFFDEYFKNGEKNFLYYWSLYFYCFTSKGNSVDIATVMANSPEKRYASYYHFSNKFELEDALKHAKTNEDIANVYAFSSVQNTYKNLNSLKQIYANKPYFELLDFLLLREINKLEDWIYTPYYTNYYPSTESQWIFENVVSSTDLLRSRSEQDRLYAKEVLDFVNSVDLKKVKNPQLWKASKIQLLFMTRSYSECLRQIADYLKTYSDSSNEQIEQIKVLCIVSSQTKGKAVITDEIKPIVLKNLNNVKFLFALGRELEYLGNFPDATALYAFINRIDYDDINLSSFVYWRDKRSPGYGNASFFYDHFSYIDFAYSAADLKTVVQAINKVPNQRFEQILYNYLLLEKEYLTDLLGTKYIREDNLNDALLTFKSMGDKYWENNYNPWERDKYADYYSFDQNPFYDFRYTPDFIPQREKFIVTKLSVTEHLVDFLKKAEDETNPKRAYYYFLVANCYFNMSQYGNSWMMRRFSSTTWFEERELYVDEQEYRANIKAKYYYQQAYKYATTRKFKALSLRMEEYVAALSEEEDKRSNYSRLQKEFPEYYRDLSSCYSLHEYFKLSK